MTYFDSIGMIHDREYDDYGNKHISENGPLFTAIYYQMKKELGRLTENDKIDIINILRILWNGECFVDRKGGIGPTSHDNITGILALSQLVKGYKPAEFEFTQFKKYHPRDLIFYGLADNKWWAWLLQPILIIFALWSCNAEKESTSGKQLWWLRLKVLGDDSLLDECTGLIRRTNGTWANVFFIYYHKDINHPIVRMAIELEKKDFQNDGTL